MNNKRINQGGFTIIELLLAVALFSFILLFVSVGFVQVNRAFNHGITIKRVHSAGRTVLDEIARNIRVSSPENTSVCPSADPDCSGALNRLCTGGVRYAWNLGNPDTTAGAETFTGATSTPFTLAKTTTGNCADTMSANHSAEMLPEGVFVRQLNVTPLAGNSRYRIEIVLSTNPTEAIEVSPGEFRCNFLSGPSAAYCDIVRLSTTVTTRN